MDHFCCTCCCKCWSALCRSKNLTAPHVGLPKPFVASEEAKRLRTATSDARHCLRVPVRALPAKACLSASILCTSASIDLGDWCSNAESRCRQACYQRIAITKLCTMGTICTMVGGLPASAQLSSSACPVVICAHPLISRERISVKIKQDPTTATGFMLSTGRPCTLCGRL